eukprot:PhF_6_TR9080/c0_g1_i1/m.14155
MTQEFHVSLTEPVVEVLRDYKPFLTWKADHMKNQQLFFDEDKVLTKPTPPQTVPLAIVRSATSEKRVSLDKTLANNKIQIVTIVKYDPAKRAFRDKMKTLKAKAEQIHYDRMVTGVTQARGEVQEELTMGKMINESGMAMDMRITTLGVSVAGYLIPKACGWAEEKCWIGAMLGAVISLLVEMILAIIRIGKHDTHEKKRKAKLNVASTLN